ncbi:unnamed protein product [Malus baccata var. baccata]
MECQERFRLCLSSFWVDREVVYLFMLVQAQTTSSSYRTMKKGRTMKEARAMKKGTMILTFMQSFPDKFLLEILTNVASRSFRYIYSTKMVCKKFNQLAQHD